MSDTPYLLAECQKTYGEERGLHIYNRFRDTLHKIYTNPTEIVLQPKAKPKCLDCGSDNIALRS